MALKHKKILVAEDEPAMREIITQKLSANQFEVSMAGDGKEAIEVWEKEKPDLVLLDLMMPEIDGFEVLKTMRGHKDKSIAKTPVIVLSNLWSKEDMNRTSAFGIEGYLVKTYNTSDDILEKINQVLSKQSSS